MDIFSVTLGATVALSVAFVALLVIGLVMEVSGRKADDSATDKAVTSVDDGIAELMTAFDSLLILLRRYIDQQDEKADTDKE